MEVRQTLLIDRSRQLCFLFVLLAFGWGCKSRSDFGSDFGREEGLVAYNAPRAKTPISPHFWRWGRCSCFSTGIGSTKMATSVTMFREALANQTALRFMQCPPGRVRSQK